MLNNFSVGDRVKYFLYVPTFEEFLTPEIGGVNWGEYTERARGVYADFIDMVSVTHQILELIDMPTSDGGMTKVLVTTDGRMLSAEQWEIVKPVSA